MCPCVSCFAPSNLCLDHESPVQSAPESQDDNPRTPASQTRSPRSGSQLNRTDDQDTTQDEPSLGQRNAPSTSFHSSIDARLEVNSSEPTPPAEVHRETTIDVRQHLELPNVTYALSSISRLSAGERSTLGSVLTNPDPPPGLTTRRSSISSVPPPYNDG